MTPLEKKEIGNRIKGLRIEKGLKQDQCRIPYGDVTIQMISGWEKGHVLPSIDSLIKIAIFYNTTIDYIITGMKKDENDRKIYTYKDAIDVIFCLSECNLFKTTPLRNIIDEFNMYTTDKNLISFLKELYKVDEARNSMKKELFNQVIEDLIEKYNTPITKRN